MESLPGADNRFKFFFHPARHKKLQILEPAFHKLVLGPVSAKNSTQQKNRLTKHERSFYFYFMGKGDDTKKKILDTGYEMASKLGLECLSIGTLANAAGMSKSGLFGHFNSKQNLLLSVLEHAGIVFNEEVVAPALKTKRGIPRIRKVMENWITWTENLSGGCIFVAAAAEYSERPGPVQDLIRRQHDAWIDSLSRIAQSAVASGEFKPDTDCERVAFELYSLIMGFYLYHNSLNYTNVKRLMPDALERLIDSCRIQND